MVEVQASKDELFGFFNDADYLLFSDNSEIKENPRDLNGNVFCLHRQVHSELIQMLGLNSAS